MLSRYSFFLRFLHSFIAISFIAMIAIGLNLKNIMPYFPDIYGLHKSIGLLLLASACMRMFVRFWLNRGVKNQKKRLFVHYGFYFIMLAFPLSGLFMSLCAGYDAGFFGMFNIPSFQPPIIPVAKVFHTLHVYIMYPFFALLTYHLYLNLYVKKFKARK
jgi:cytochrome b561